MSKQLTAPLNLQVMLNVLPAVVLFASMVGGYVSLSSKLDYTAQLTKGTSEDVKLISQGFNNHEVRLSILESEKKRQSSFVVSHKIALQPEPAMVPIPEYRPVGVVSQSATTTVEKAPNPTLIPTPLPIPKIDIPEKSIINDLVSKLL